MFGELEEHASSAAGVAPVSKDFEPALAAPDTTELEVMRDIEYYVQLVSRWLIRLHFSAQVFRHLIEKPC